LQAAILAAGLGKRLCPITEVMAKPAIKVLDQPLLFWIVRSLIDSGIDELAFNLYHIPESILRLNLPSKFPGCRMRFIIESQLLGTAGGLRNILWATGWESTIVVCNGDSLWTFDIEQALHRHKELGAELTLVLTAQASTHVFTPVGVDEALNLVRIGKHIKSITQKGEIRDYVFTGVYIFEPQVLWRLMRSEAVHLIRDFVVPLLHTSIRIVGIPIDGFWADLGTSQRYLNDVLRFAEYTFGEKPDIVMGYNCSVAATACMQKVILWDNVTIGAEARIQNSILLSNVVAPPKSSIKNAVVIPRPKCELDEVGCCNQLGDALVWPIA